MVGDSQVGTAVELQPGEKGVVSGGCCETLEEAALKRVSLDLCNPSLSWLGLRMRLAVLYQPFSAFPTSDSLIRFLMLWRPPPCPPAIRLFFVATS